MRRCPASAGHWREMADVREKDHPKGPHFLAQNPDFRIGHPADVMHLSRHGRTADSLVGLFLPADIRRPSPSS
jgi:hypothetical protein